MVENNIKQENNMLKIKYSVNISIFLIILFVFGCGKNNKYDINLNGNWKQYIESSFAMNDIKFNNGIYEYYFWEDIAYKGIYFTKENQLTIKINQIFGSSFSLIHNIYPLLDEKWYLEDELTLTSVIKDYYSDGSSAIMEEVYNRIKD